MGERERLERNAKEIESEREREKNVGVEGLFSKIRNML